MYVCVCIYIYIYIYVKPNNLKFSHWLSQKDGAGAAIHRYTWEPLQIILPLVSREWKNGSNSSYNCTPFLHSLLTKDKSCQNLGDVP